MKSDSLTVREWIGLFTDREPPLPIALLDRPVNTAPRRELRSVVQWLTETDLGAGAARQGRPTARARA